MLDKLLLLGCTAVALSAGAWDRIVGKGQGDTVYLTSGQPIAAAPVPSAGSGPVTVRRDLDGLFRLPVDIAGTRVAMIVDTGASRSILAAQTARGIAALPRPTGPHGRVRTLSGTQSFALAEPARLVVHGRTVDGVGLAVMETPDGVSVLGQDILPRLGRLTLDGDSLTLH